MYRSRSFKQFSMAVHRRHSITWERLRSISIHGDWSSSDAKPSIQHGKETSLKIGRPRFSVSWWVLCTTGVWSQFAWPVIEAGWRTGEDDSQGNVQPSLTSYEFVVNLLVVLIKSVENSCQRAIFSTNFLSHSRATQSLEAASHLTLIILPVG